MERRYDDDFIFATLFSLLVDEDDDEDDDGKGKQPFG